MNDTIVTPTDNKRYIKIDKYETLLTEKDSIKSIEYKERLIQSTLFIVNFDIMNFTI